MSSSHWPIDVKSTLVENVSVEHFLDPREEVVCEEDATKPESSNTSAPQMEGKEEAVAPLENLEKSLWAHMRMCLFSSQTNIIDDDGNVYRGRARLKMTSPYILPAGETIWMDSCWRLAAPVTEDKIGVFTVRPERKYFGIRIAQGLYDGGYNKSVLTCSKMSLS